MKKLGIFLFPFWSNDREYAKERMRFIIENKAIPEFSDDELIFEGFPWKKEG